MTLRADGGGGALVSGTTPISGGTDKQILFNDGGVVSGDSQFLWNKTANAITSDNAFSGAIRLDSAAVEFGRIGSMATILGAVGDYGTGSDGMFVRQAGGYHFGSGASANTTVDTSLLRAAAKVVGFSASSGAGGTFRAVATSPAQITSNQDNYNPGGSSYFQRWNTDASRNITGMTFSAAQVDGQAHVIVNVGTQDIVLKHQTTSTAANQFLNSTGADITLTANQAADAWYDGTSVRWRVFKRN